MDQLRQFTIILVTYAIGVYISSWLPFPLPGSVIGMLLLFIALCTRLIRLDQVESASGFLLDNLAFFFLPAGVGLLAYTTLLQSVGLPLLVVTLVTTWMVMAFTGHIVQWMLKRKEI